MWSKKCFQFYKGLRFEELNLVKKKMFMCAEGKEDWVKWEKMSSQREWQNARKLSAQTQNGNNVMGYANKMCYTMV